MSFKTLDDLPDDLTGKRVLVRVDLNVPMEGARVTDDTRLRAMLPTVLELSDRGAIVLLLSHFGRPKGEKRPDMSTAQLVLPLHRLSGRSVRFIEDCQGPEAERAIAEVIREKALHLTRDEVPHALTVDVEEVGETVRALILVETESQKGILIGKKGAMIREIGTRARPEVEALVGHKVFLELVVKVRPRWRRDRKTLERLGL